MSQKPIVALVISALMVLSTVLVVAIVPGGAGLAAAAATPPATTTAPTVTPSAELSSSPTPATTLSSPSTTPASALPPSVNCSSLESTANDPAYASFVQNVTATGSRALASGLPAADLHLPYAGKYPSQVVNGVMESGNILTAECSASSEPDAPEPTGIQYTGVVNPTGTPHDLTIDSNSIAAILTINSTKSFYLPSGTPTAWGAQENLVLTNVTILGQQCAITPCTTANAYSFWLQNAPTYDTRNDTIYFVDDTWNFTTGAGEKMSSSSLVSWSPNGGNYTGVWIAFSRVLLLPAPVHDDVVRQHLRELRGGPGAVVQL